MERKSALWNSVESRTIDFLIVCSQMPEHSSDAKLWHLRVAFAKGE